MGLKNQLFLSRDGLAEAFQRPSSWVLVGVNIGLIVAVVEWNWSVFDIVFLYWVENLVIGGINVLKMAVASGKSPQQGTAIKLFLIPFFIIHYGMFCYGHGVFVFSMFGDLDPTQVSRGPVDALTLLSGSMLLAVALLAASHIFSFLGNFIARGEYQKTQAAELMMRPYGRIVALHITIIIGAFLTTAFGNPLGLLVVLMVLKTLVDLAMHQSEREKYSKFDPADIAGRKIPSD
jgi:hypothetical protein